MVQWRLEDAPAKLLAKAVSNAAIVTDKAMLAAVAAERPRRNANPRTSYPPSGKAL